MPPPKPRFPAAAQGLGAWRPAGHTQLLRRPLGPHGVGLPGRVGAPGTSAPRDWLCLFLTYLSSCAVRSSAGWLPCNDTWVEATVPNPTGPRTVAGTSPRASRVRQPFPPNTQGLSMPPPCAAGWPLASVGGREAGPTRASWGPRPLSPLTGALSSPSPLARLAGDTCARPNPLPHLSPVETRPVDGRLPGSVPVTAQEGSSRRELQSVEDGPHPGSCGTA